MAPERPATPPPDRASRPDWAQPGFKVQDVQRLSVADDEVLVFRCKDHITAAQAERLKETAARVFTALRQDQIVVLSGDVNLSVVKRNDLD